MKNKNLSYGEAIRDAFQYILQNYPESFVIGQGLWSPWYVGNSMTDLDKEFGKDRIIDTPVSEGACTGLAVGASLYGSKPIVVHPRIDFMLYAMDPIVNQAAKWSHMTGGKSHPGVTIRGIVNRGGEQGAQHSQSLHSWFSHIPGLRVVMPYSVKDARDLMIASVLCNDPVVYIDDKWLYAETDNLEPFSEDFKLEDIGPKVIKKGTDITLVASSYSTKLALDLANDAEFSSKFSAEVIDLRVLNPLKKDVLLESVKKTSNLVVIDGGTKTCGYASEVISTVLESVEPKNLNSSPIRIALPDCPAPTSRVLENIYYPDTSFIKNKIFSKYA